MGLKITTLVGGERMYAHSTADCDGQPVCVVHRPSHHRMSGFPQHWRGDTGVERICPHGVGHPDPDHLAFVARTRGDEASRIDSVHGCDGCCAPQFTNGSQEAAETQ